MRGTFCRGAIHHARNRFIPAGAGNISKRTIKGNPETVHPRWCGEHAGHDIDVAVCGGSSPLVRGTSSIQLTPKNHLRFIPAGAGNIQRMEKITDSWTVHPRWCGEHDYMLPEHYYHYGSSPLVRGTSERMAGHARDGRFIPAGAGNMPIHSCQAIRRPVHPRWCGEHFYDVVDAVHGVGSSPLVRGTCMFDYLYQSMGRFIPAGAGNIHPSQHQYRRHAVHPRWCGEHIVLLGFVQNGGGSSPLVRGTFDDMLKASENYRFIPAGAGNIHFERLTS